MHANGDDRMSKDKSKDNLTITDIAKLAGVSKTTVSRVINNVSDGMTIQTRTKVLKVIEESGYRPSNIARS